MINAENQIFPQGSNDKIITSVYTTQMPCIKFKANVKKMLEKLSSDSTISKSNTGTLCHQFNNRLVTSAQHSDLMNFRSIGQDEYEQTTKYYIFRNPSVRPPKHRKQLLTFTERKSRRRKVTDIEKERKLQIECWKKSVAFAEYTGTAALRGYQQCIELPRAIASTDGNPTKGSKANTTSVRKTIRFCITTNNSYSPTIWLASYNCYNGRNVFNKHSTLECS